MPELRLRLLSYNIQVATPTAHWGHYFTGAWRHALPRADMRPTLDRIADLVRGYDFVAIQEADAGSLRTGALNQIEYLAERAGYPHAGHTVTRDLRPVARHCHGFLSRLPPAAIEAFALPTPIPGRRAMRVTLGPEAGGLTLLLTHLSLGRASQQRQLKFLCALAPGDAPTVLMGDLNCEPALLREHRALRRSGWQVAEACPPTFPSWRPTRSIDHVLATGGARLLGLATVPEPLSDHLPLAADVAVTLPG